MSEWSPHQSSSSINIGHKYWYPVAGPKHATSNWLQNIIDLGLSARHQRTAAAPQQHTVNTPCKHLIIHLCKQLFYRSWPTKDKNSNNTPANRIQSAYNMYIRVPTRWCPHVVVLWWWSTKKEHLLELTWISSAGRRSSKGPLKATWHLWM